MSRTFKATFLTILLACIYPIVGAAQSSDVDDKGFYNRDAEGWFWYIDPDRDKKKKPEKPKEKKYESSADSKKGPPTLSTAWLRENLPKYRDLAIDHPTQENVAAYYYLQRYVFDKSQKFAEMSIQVVKSDPLLDENTRRPISSYASMQATRFSSKNSKVLAKRIADRAGLVFFFHSECPYCSVQVSALKILERQLGITIKAVSLDGKPLPGNPFPEFVTDRGQAKKLGVVATPAFYLIDPPNQVVPIGQGVMTVPEITDRIVDVAASQGWITEDEYQRTKAARTDLNMDTSIEAGTKITEYEMRDTKKLVEFMRTLYSQGGSSVVRPLIEDNTSMDGSDK